MNHKIPRLINMLFFIQSRPGVTAAGLAERYMISQRQVYRDINELEDAGVPIYYDYGYRVLNEWEHLFYWEEGEHELSNKINP